MNSVISIALKTTMITQVKVKNQIMSGTAEAVTGSEGPLVRLPDGREEIVHAGDVTILKE